MVHLGAARARRVGRRLGRAFRLWDGLWYKLIAEEGYGGTTGLRSGPCCIPAFWPLFPWLMRLGGDIFGVATETAGWLIANLGFLVALVVLYRIMLAGFRPARGPPHDHRLGRLPDLALLLRRLHGVALPAPGRRGALFRPARVWFTAGVIGAARRLDSLPGRLSPSAVRRAALAAIWGPDQGAPAVAEHPADRGLRRVTRSWVRSSSGCISKATTSMPERPGEHQPLL